MREYVRKGLAKALCVVCAFILVQGASVAQATTFSIITSGTNGNFSFSWLHAGTTQFSDGFFKNGNPKERIEGQIVGNFSGPTFNINSGNFGVIGTGMDTYLDALVSEPELTITGGKLRGDFDGSGNTGTGGSLMGGYMSYSYESNSGTEMGNFYFYPKTFGGNTAPKPNDLTPTEMAGWSNNFVNTINQATINVWDNVFGVNGIDAMSVLNTAPKNLGGNTLPTGFTQLGIDLTADAPPEAPPSVPEPLTGALSAMGLGVLACGLRRRVG